MVLLRHCAASQFNHLWRTIPSKLTQRFAKKVEDMIWNTVCVLLGIPTEVEQQQDLEFNLGRARSICFLPSNIGGLGLSSPVRTSRCAFVGGWAAALAELQKIGSPAFEWWSTRLQQDDVRESTLPGDVQGVMVALIEDLATLGKQASNLFKVKESSPLPVTEEILKGTPATVERFVGAISEGRTGGLQRRLYQMASQLQWVELFNSLSSNTLRAALRSRTAKGAQNHLVAMPSHRLLYASPDEMIFTLRNALFLPLFNGKVQSTWLDPGDYDCENYVKCLKLLMSGHHSPAHTSVLSTLRSMLEAVGITYYPETSYTKVDANGIKGRGDFSENVLGSIVGAKTLYDLTLISPAAKEYEVEAQRRPEAAAEKAERKKCEENHELCRREGWMFSPLGVEETGNFGNGMRTLIKKCANRAGMYPESTPICENWSSPNFQAFWSQAIRFTLCRSLRARFLAVLEQKAASIV
jgi:hypothetical protein